MAGAKPGKSIPRTPTGFRGRSGGFATTGTVKALAGIGAGMLLMKGATLGYDVYLSSANELANHAQAVTYCHTLHALYAMNELPENPSDYPMFMIGSEGITYELQIIKYQGCKYWSMVYQHETWNNYGPFWWHWGVFYEPYVEAVYVMHPKVDGAFKCHVDMP